LPVDGVPETSVMLPRGMPPPRTASTSTMPVANNSGACLILGVKAAGTRFASLVSIWRRIAEEEGIVRYIRLIFAYPCLPLQITIAAQLEHCQDKLLETCGLLKAASRTSARSFWTEVAASTLASWVVAEAEPAREAGNWPC